MSRPRVLLMDEPSMGLAPQVVGLVLDKVIAIRNAGMLPTPYGSPITYMSFVSGRSSTRAKALR
jgi:hypothetical protein